MAPQDILAELWQLHARAPAAARGLGDAALAVGIGGLLLALRWSWGQRQDRKSLDRASSTTRPGRLRPSGPTAAALRDLPWTLDGATNLSPDAADAAIRGRLESLLDSRASVVRFLAYAPLLLGLCGTILGLASLLQALTGGQDRMSEAGQGLAAVFVGTLLGIVGSLAAGTGGVLLSRSAERLLARAEGYVHTFVLPSIVERKIQIRIEEAVLETLTARTHSAVSLFAEALQPLAKSLLDSAAGAAQAAERSAEAFDVATRALRQAGDLEAAARLLAQGMGQLEPAAARLERAGSVVHDVTLVQGELHERISTAVRTLEQASERVAESIRGSQHSSQLQAQGLQHGTEALAGSVASLQQEVLSIREDFRQLAADVRQRNALENQKLDEARTHTLHFTAALGQVAAVSAGVHQELAAMRQTLEGFGSSAAQAIGRDLTAKVDELCQRLSEVLAGFHSVMPAAAAEMREAGRSLSSDLHEARSDLPEVLRAVQELRAAAAQMSAVVQQIAELQTGPARPELRSMADALSGSLGHLDAIRGLLAERLPPREAHRPRWAFWR
jgi:hypothetical protein